ncbi:MAG: RluA family pseudouridine synthase [Alphaproteobacteria bacterium]
MSGVETVTVGSDEGGMRLDRWFKQHYPVVTHGRLQKLLRTGQIRVDGKRAKADNRLAVGAAVRVPPLGDQQASPKPQYQRVRPEDAKELKDAILYKDDWVIAINKPAGLAVQGGSKTSRHLDGMLDALRLGAKERPRLVHRLDKDTSGVLLLARSRKAASALAEAFKDRRTEKTYWALVRGVPRPREGEITSLLDKSGEDIELVRPDMKGRKAITEYAVIDQAGQQSAWLALRPVTGRTHQLRVHCAQLGTPIVGDGKYGGTEAFFDGVSNKLHLHARRIVIPHPQRGTLDVTAALPDHMKATWALFEFDPDAEEDPFADE